MEDNAHHQPKQAREIQTHLLASDDLLSPLFSVSVHGRSKKTYTVYGFIPAEQQTVRLGFSGACIDLLTGNYALGNGHRFFNPVLMRFNSPDSLSPFGAGGVNGYCYCQGDPINYSDPSGQTPQIKSMKPKPPPLQIQQPSKPGLLATARQSLTEGPLPPETYSPPRQHIQQNVPKNSLFGRSVRGVNANLGSHGDNNLTLQKADLYVSLAQSPLSETSKFFNSGLDWFQSAIAQPSPSNLVGAAFNFAGAIVAGAIDKNRYTTGAILGSPGSTGTTADSWFSMDNIRKATD